MAQSAFSFILGIIAAIKRTITSVSANSQGTLWPLVQSLQKKKWVDLTHSFDPSIPHWKGLPLMEQKTLYDHDKDGFRIYQYTFAGQWGTHVDPPLHFHKGLRALDEIPLTEMVLPCVVIDVHEKAIKDPDYQLKLDDLESFEKKHGPIPAHSFVAMRTDWSKRWPDNEKMLNKDTNGVSHFPGWSKETLSYLFETRHITAVGHETADTDPGVATSKCDYSLESYILGLNHFQVEMLTSLDQLPEAGALIILSWPKASGGTGFPARVFAILP